MSGLAKFKAIKSYSFFCISFTTLSAIARALISGASSYEETFFEGTIILSSPLNGSSFVPFKKNVTCAYFVVSAICNCRNPFSEITCARQCSTCMRGKAISTGKSFSYSAIVVKKRFSSLTRSNLSNSGSTKDFAI